MAQMKRAAEKVITNKGKKARVSTSSDESPSRHNDHDIADSAAEATGSSQTPGESFSGMIDRLQSFQAQAATRDEWATGFSRRVKQKQSEISKTIEAAKAQIVEDKENFQEDMHMILSSLSTGLVLEPDEQVDLEPLHFEAPKPTASMQKATELINDCEALIECYQSLCSTSEQTPPDSKMREVFQKDQQETIRAFEASKKMAINQLQARFADKMGEVRDRFTLDETETVLGNRVMSYGKLDKDAEDEQGSEGLGTLLHGFGKVVGKMQGLIEG